MTVSYVKLTAPNDCLESHSLLVWRIDNKFSAQYSLPAVMEIT
jgi:hypothetical protein